MLFAQGSTLSAGASAPEGPILQAAGLLPTVSEWMLSAAAGMFAAYVITFVVFVTAAHLRTRHLGPEHRDPGAHVPHLLPLSIDDEGGTEPVRLPDRELAREAA